MAASEWKELELLTARISALQKRREATPKRPVGWLREMHREMLRLERQRDMLVGYLKSANSPRGWLVCFTQAERA
ncbi:MAG: hypothetical protein JO033_21630 [Acidobacteriaceae bacterium]|nr:hypothetical protein [Acidobacteriota bacterium]MBV8811278.1 hypothetical protein [Acidobacteriaceae bacterium]